MISIKSESIIGAITHVVTVKVSVEPTPERAALYATAVLGVVQPISAIGD